MNRRLLLTGFGGALLASAFRASAAPSPNRSPPMVIEYIRYEIAASRREAFLAAWRDAASELRGSPHCLRYEVSRGVEEPGHFVVRLEWDSLEGHERGFRASPGFGPFFQKVKPFYEAIREMKHYALSDVVSG